MIVIACPSMEYVDSLSTQKGFEPYFAESKNGRIIFVFHITPAHVINSSTYQNWMKKFGPKTQVTLLILLLQLFCYIFFC